MFVKTVVSVKNQVGSLAKKGECFQQNLFIPGDPEFFIEQTEVKTVTKWAERKVSSKNDFENNEGQRMGEVDIDVRLMKPGGQQKSE